ncbi:MAG: bifunctional folylpolyglutamate synthase/dihydrofolate synthase [Planctomycetota bacterium]
MELSNSSPERARERDSSLAALLRRLSVLDDWERRDRRSAHRFDLAVMEDLCERLGRPQYRLGRVVQVAGSKGKGTVVSLLAGMARLLGLEDAAYMSPHVRDIRERVLWRGSSVSETELASALGRVLDAAKPETTWFEALTAAALSCFAARGPDLTVLEVGLGGRLDSTTVVPKELTCITGIELEHTEVLGDSIEAITKEKAGILRPGVPCVTGAKGRALEIIEARARELGSRLAVLGREIRIHGLECVPGGLRGSVEAGGRRSGTLNFPMHAVVQVRSFALALGLLAELVPDRVEELLEADPRDWIDLPPGRFQVLEGEPMVVLDGAHTDASLAVLAEGLETAFPAKRYVLVFAIAPGKRWRRGLGRLASLVDTALVARLGQRSSEDPERIRSFLEELDVPCRSVSSIALAVRESLDALSREAACRGEAGRGLLVTGSFYAIGEALEVLSPRRSG